MSVRAAVAAFIASFTRTTTDPYYDNVVLLAHADGANNATASSDSSKYARSLTAYGQAKLSTAQQVFGTASYVFDGTTDAIGAAHSAELSVGSQDFTFECRVRMATVSNHRAVFTKRATNSGNGLGEWQLFFDFGSGRWAMGFNTSGGTAYPVVVGTSSPSAGVWYSLCVEKEGATGRLYVNGVLEATTAIGTTTLLGNTSALVIGAAGGDLGASMDGWIDEVRYTMGIARYKGVSYSPAGKAFPDTGPLDTYFDKVVLLAHLDGANNGTSFVESSGIPKAITANGAAKTSTAASLFGGASYLGNGSTSWCQVAYHSSFDVGTGDFTMEVALYQVNATSPNQQLILTRQKDSGPNIAFQLSTIAGVPTIALRGSGGGTVFSLSAPSAIPLNSWQRVAVTREAGLVRLFVNGAMVNSGTCTFALDDSTKGWVIGAGDGNSPGSGFWYNGYIDEVRITKGVARYIADYAVSVGPFPNVTDSVISMLFDTGNGSTAFVDSGYGGSVWSIGAGAITCSTATVLDGVSSLNIPSGGTAYLTAPATEKNMLPATKNFSLKFKARAGSWLRPDTTGCYLISIQGAAGTGAVTQFAIATNSSQYPALVFSDGTTRTVVTGTAGLPVNTTIDFELKRSGASLILYVNGAVAISTTFSGAFNQNAGSPWHIGCPAGATGGPSGGMVFDAFKLTVS